MWQWVMFTRRRSIPAWISYNYFCANTFSGSCLVDSNAFLPLDHTTISIMGTPTWHTDAESERSGTSWDQWLYEDLPKFDFKDKKVAIFGVGDAVNYPENFCDAMGELYDCFVKSGAKMYGAQATDVIEFSESKSIRDGKFVGAVFDEDNESDKSQERAATWLTALKSEGFPL